MLAGALIDAGRGPNRCWQGPKQVLAGAQIGAGRGPKGLARPEVCRGTGTGGARGAGNGQEVSTGAKGGTGKGFK